MVLGDSGSDENLTLFLVSWCGNGLGQMYMLYAPRSVVSLLLNYSLYWLVLSLNKLKAPQGWSWGYLATGISPAKSTVPDPNRHPINSF